MCSLNSFDINLKGLKANHTQLVYQLKNDYFEALEGAEVSKGEVSVELDIRKVTDDYFELDFQIDGQVTVICDRCLDEMQQDIQTEARLMAKIGEEYSEEDDLVTIDEASGILNVAWLIYEFIALQIPIKHVHAPGKCNSAMIQMLNEHSATRSSDEDEEKPIDPRWSGLLKIKEETKESNN